MSNQDALIILKRLRSAGYEAYFAGGCVRDLLMGQTPKDYDVATNAPPNQVRGLFKNTQAVGAAFGVILVREGSSTIEVATFRTDMEYEDGRHPTGVKFATAQEDAQRRDFTINGLFLDPVENRIIDYVGGQADLAAKKLRAIGNADARFAEDHLRMLRAVRFASRLGFEIDSATSTAIESHAHELIRISPERIAEELRKMLLPITRMQAYRLLRQLGFIPILMRYSAITGPGRSDGPIDLFLALESPAISFGLALAAMRLDYRMNISGQHDPRHWLTIAEVTRAVNAMRQTFKISNDESNELVGSMSFLKLLEDTPPSVATLKRFLNQPHSDDATRLMTAMAKCDLRREQIQAVLNSLDQYRNTEFAPIPLITGDDLTSAGASPGPKFKPALDAAYDAQLEGRISTKDQAMKMAMQVLR
jgi:poly(A) polymerase